jgi:hypothetical protein
MFAPYLFESRQTQRRVTLGRWSYLWAGLFGPAYVLSKGGGWYVLQALALTLGLTLAFAGLVAATSYVPAFQQTVVVCIAVPVGLIFQSVKTVAILRTSYRRRGWRVRMND